MKNEMKKEDEEEKEEKIQVLLKVITSEKIFYDFNFAFIFKCLNS